MYQLDNLDNVKLYELFWEHTHISTCRTLTPSTLFGIYTTYTHRNSAVDHCIFEDSLLQAIPFDVITSILNSMDQAGRAISVCNLISKLVTVYCMEPLNHPDLLLTIDLFFQHNISRHISNLCYQSLLWKAFTRFPPCQSIIMMILNKSITLDFTPITQYAVEENRDDILGLFRELNLNNNSISIPPTLSEIRVTPNNNISRWEEYLRHLLHFTEGGEAGEAGESGKQCYQCLRDHKLLQFPKGSTSILFSIFESKQDKSTKNKILKDRVCDLLVKINPVNDIEAFSLDKLEDIPLFFLYHFKMDKEVYVFDITYLRQHISTTDKNPFNQQPIPYRIIRDICDSYAILEKSFHHLKGCSCIQN